MFYGNIVCEGGVNVVNNFSKYFSIVYADEHTDEWSVGSGILEYSVIVMDEFSITLV